LYSPLSSSWIIDDKGYWVDKIEELCLTRKELRKKIAQLNKKAEKDIMTAMNIDLEKFYFIIFKSFLFRIQQNKSKSEIVQEEYTVEHLIKANGSLLVIKVLILD
jgi:hypothetical protein